MKKYNKANSNWVILGLVLPILMFFISMNFVYAYFTATATPAKSSGTTGIIRIGFTDATTEQINSASISDAQKLVPGDVLKIEGGVENKGTAAFYAVLHFNIVITKADGSVEEYSKFYTIKNTALAATTENDNNLKEITGTEGNYTATAFELEDPNENKTNTYKTPFRLTYDFEGSVYDDTYQGASVSYCVTAYAIQTANLTENSAQAPMVATNLLIEKITNFITAE